MANPFKSKINSKKFHRPEGAGNFDNMDDHNIVKTTSLLQGTIQHTPTDNKDIVNKKYVNDEINALPSPIVYLLRDGSNANSNINIGAYNFTTTNTIFAPFLALSIFLYSTIESDNFVFYNQKGDGDYEFKFKDGAVNKTITIDASENTLNLGDSNLTTTGRFGIGTTTPDSFFEIAGAGSGNQMRLTHAAGYYTIFERADNGHFIVREKTGAEAEATLLDIANITGNTLLIGDLGVGGDVDFDSDLNVDGKFQVWGSGTQSHIKLMHTSTFYSIIERDGSGNLNFKNRSGSGAGVNNFSILAAGPSIFYDKVLFTQTDGNEYIDSLNDGYLDVGATTGIRLKQDTDVEGNLTASTIQADDGFTGTGAYTNFTIVGGIITSAS